MGRVLQVHLTGEDDRNIEAVRSRTGAESRSLAVRLALAEQASAAANGAVVAVVARQTGRRSSRRTASHDILFNVRLRPEDEANLRAVMARLGLKKGEAVRYCLRASGKVR